MSFPLSTGPILAVYGVGLSHVITCPFSKYFQNWNQILPKFSNILPFFNISSHFFLKNHTHALFSRIDYDRCIVYMYICSYNACIYIQVHVHTKSRFMLNSCCNNLAKSTPSSNYEILHCDF